MRQVALQPSPGSLLPSSHSSAPSILPFPQADQPMSAKACTVSSVMKIDVRDGSISSLGKRLVLKWETEEPGCFMAGAYISTCPPGPRPEVSTPLALTTFAPTQWRSPVFVLAATRSASVMAG